MRAWLMDGFDGIGRLRMGDVPAAIPAEGEVVLAVDYAALNPADRYLSEGQYPARPPLPHILGRDGVGRVVSLGPGVKGTEVGQQMALLRGEVGVTRPGTLAERVAVPVASLVPIPPGWTAQEAAAAPLVYLTAYQALTQWGDLPPSVVLVTGASGGVGVASVHLARALGHTVVALSRSAEKGRRLREIGADHVFDPAAPGWRKSALAAIAPRRVDLAIDNIGGALLPQVIETLGELGRVSLVGRLAGPVPEFNTASLFFRRLRMGGVAVGSYTPEESRHAWTEILALMNRISARPLIDGVFEFDEAPKAFERLAAGPMGKVVVKVGGK